MQRFFSILFVALIFSTAISAQTKDEQAVATSVETLRKAMVGADQPTLTKLAHDSLSYGHSTGKVESKAAFVENIVNGNTDFVTIDLTGQTITVAGKTAIVRHRLSGTTNDKGKDPGTVNIGVMTVWVKEKKEWKLLARQAVKLM